MIDAVTLRRILAIIGLLLAILALIVPDHQIVEIIVAVVILAIAVLL